MKLFGFGLFGSVLLAGCPQTELTYPLTDAPPDAPETMVDPATPDTGVKPGFYIVYKVTDGDTVRVVIDGQDERLRYIGIDAPEVAHEGESAEPYGQEAFIENRMLVEGKAVRIEYDEEVRDRYGRLLGYVYLEDETFLNAKILEDGLAKTLTIPPNTRHRALFEQLEAEARAAHRGLWR